MPNRILYSCHVGYRTRVVILAMLIHAIGMKSTQNLSRGPEKSWLTTVLALRYDDCHVT